MFRRGLSLTWQAIIYDGFVSEKHNTHGNAQAPVLQIDTLTSEMFIVFVDHA